MDITAGVIQGCPLSGSLFAISLEPFLRIFQNRYVDPGYGRVYACADDIAISSHTILSFNHLVRIFSEIE
eukprot:4330198-Karenia_brevis.AAC.1